MATKKVTKKKTAKKVVKKVIKKTTEKIKASCSDTLCPRHGKQKLKLRGRTFEGEVIRKFSGRVTIELVRMLKIPKYERYEKRKTKLHARLPDCMGDISIGDRIQIAETRPISKTIHFVAHKIIKKVNGEQQ